MRLESKKEKRMRLEFMETDGDPRELDLVPEWWATLRDEARHTGILSTEAASGIVETHRTAARAVSAARRSITPISMGIYSLPMPTCLTNKRLCSMFVLVSMTYAVNLLAG